MIKKITAIWILLLISMLAPYANAGQSGNGGDVVVCIADGRIQSVQFLDLYEAKTLRKIQYNLGDKNLSVQAKIELALTRLHLFSPVRGETYLAQSEAFFGEALFLKGVKLDDVPDAGYLALPVGCNIEQIVIQQEPRFPGDPRYTVSQDLWDFLDNDSKAALILHEVIYREAISYGHTYSIATRYFNSLIFGDQLKNLTMKGFVDRLYMLPFTQTDFNGIQITIAVCEPLPKGTWNCNHAKIGWPTFYPSGNLKEFQRDHSPDAKAYHKFRVGRYDVNGDWSPSYQKYTDGGFTGYIVEVFYDLPKLTIQRIQLHYPLMFSDGKSEFQLDQANFDEQGYIIK